MVINTYAIRLIVRSRDFCTLQLVTGFAECNYIQTVISIVTDFSICTHGCCCLLLHQWLHSDFQVQQTKYLLALVIWKEMGKDCAYSVLHMCLFSALFFLVEQMSKTN